MIGIKMNGNSGEKLVYVTMGVSNWEKIEVHSFEHFHVHQHVSISHNVAIFVVPSKICCGVKQSLTKLFALFTNPLTCRCYPFGPKE
jgi:hypothetical protein